MFEISSIETILGRFVEPTELGNFFCSIGLVPNVGILVIYQLLNSRMLWYSLISFLVALLSVICIRRYFRLHAQRYAEDIPQRFHHGAVSRLGGLGIFLGWMAGLLLAMVIDRDRATAPGGWMIYGSIITLNFVVVSIGAIDDYTQTVSPRWRLVLTAVTAISAVHLLNLTVPHLDVPLLDLFWDQWPILGVLLTLLGLIGLTHAFNLIDGYNGLAGLVAILIGLSYAYVSFIVGDGELFIMAVCLVAATLGFLILNYPRGLIFAGDGGAYFWGFTLALIGILLVQRHQQVSPWYPLLLLIYPIWETTFSTYRKLVRNQSPIMADALHLHHLVYHRLVKAVPHEDKGKMFMSRNNRTTPYLVVLTMLTIVPATLFWTNTILLITSTFLFVAFYCAAYILIVRFKVPKWLANLHLFNSGSK